jgi:glycogenin glucosyltransferase
MTYDFWLTQRQRPQYTPGKPFVPPSTTIQQYVVGEATDVHYGFAPEDRIAAPPPTEIAPHIATTVYSESAPEIPSITIEPPFTEPGETAENLEQGATEPTPTVEQRRFSAPQMEWDATR